MFDIADGIALGVAAAAGGAIEADIDAGGRAAEIDRVDAGAAIDRVALAIGIERVVAAPAIEHAGAIGATAQGIAIERGPFDLFDIGQHIALRPAARADRAIGADRHCCVGIAIIDNIPTCAAIDAVGAQPGQDRIVASTAVEAVVACAALQGVVARPCQNGHAAVIANDMVVLRRTDHFLDIGQPVARGVAAGGIAAVHINRHAGGGRGRIIDHVEAGAAVVAVGAKAGNERIVARAAKKAFIPSRSFEHVTECRTDDRFDSGHRIALGIAAR